MAIEKDAQRQIAFIQELVFGTTPATPTGQILRHVSESLGVDMALGVKLEERPRLSLITGEPTGRVHV